MKSHGPHEKDLFAESTALIERAKAILPAVREPLVFGFRSSGALSIYFSATRAYHFNPQNELRRIFLDGTLYKAHAGQLIRIERIPESTAVRLRNIELLIDFASELIGEMNTYLLSLQDAVDTEQLRIVRQIPEHAQMITRLRECIPQLLENRIAISPHANG